MTGRDAIPRSVLDAFGAVGAPERLAGGQRATWRVGELVLKPADTSAGMLAWLAELLHSLDHREDFRVAPPVRSRAGQLTVEGWTAWRYEPGRAAPGRWSDIVDVGGRFHNAVRRVQRPTGLDARTDRWAIADRVAWEELDWTDYADTKHLARLVVARRPLDARSQLVHGDLTGNVHFADGRAPLVLDVSPYWRPTGYAEAIVIADALVFHGADASVVPRTPDFAQYLLRALIFRAVTDQLARAGQPPRPDGADPYRPAVQLALRRATVQVRVAEPHDIAAIGRLVHDAYQHYVPRIGTQPGPMLADYAAIVATGHAWVAVTDRAIVGVLVLEPRDDYLLLENVAVDPDQHGRGIGSELLAFAEQQAVASGFDTIRLYTNVAMTENLAYYPRRGYRETHRATENGYGRVHFVKTLR